MSRHKKLARRARQRRHSRGGGRHPRILTTYETVTPESAEHGDVADRGWIDDEGESMAPDSYDRSEGLTAVDKAVRFLKDNGAGEASSSYFHRGIWYSDYGSEDYRTGENEQRSYHLKGFTAAQEREIFNQMSRRR